MPLLPCQPECQFRSGLARSTAPGPTPMVMEATSITSASRPRLLPPCSILSRTSSSSEQEPLFTPHHHQYSIPSQPIYESPSLCTSDHSYSPAHIYSPSSSSSPFPTSISPSHNTFEELQVPSDIPFLDTLIAEVRQEMMDVMTPSPSTSSDISSVSRKSSASSSSSVRDVIVSPGQTLVIRGDDGQEYKVSKVPNI